MRQYVLPPGLTAGADGTIELGGKDARRLASVLRLGAGDRFPALSSDGIRHEAEVLEIRPGFVRLRLSAEAGAPDAFLHDIRAGRRQEASHGEAMQAPKDKLALPRFVLAIGMLKGSKLDDVVRMAVEAGAAAVVPLASERSVPKGEFAGRLARLRRVRDEALGQSGSETRTAIEEPLGLAEFLTLYPAGPDRLGVVFHETPLAEAPLHRY